MIESSPVTQHPSSIGWNLLSTFDCFQKICLLAAKSVSSLFLEIAASHHPKQRWNARGLNLSVQSFSRWRKERREEKNWLCLRSSSIRWKTFKKALLKRGWKWEDFIARIFFLTGNEITLQEEICPGREVNLGLWQTDNRRNPWCLEVDCVISLWESARFKLVRLHSNGLCKILFQT